MTDNISALGFNGEFLDSTLDNYHLGNGYRAYNPATMAFTGADDMSPFGHGGINPYVYCSGDPINNTDPTGHFAFLGLAFTIVGMLSPIPNFTREATTPELMQWAFDAGQLAVDTMDVFTGGVITPAIPVMEVVEATLTATLDHAVVRETEDVAAQELAPSVDYLTSEAGASRATAPVKHEATNAIKKIKRTPQEIRDRINKAIKDARTSGSDLQRWKLTREDGEEREAFIFPYQTRSDIASGGIEYNLGHFLRNVRKNSHLEVERGTLNFIRQPWEGPYGFKERYKEEGLFIHPQINNSKDIRMSLSRLAVVTLHWTGD